MRCAVKILEHVAEGNSRKSQIKLQSKTHIYLGVYNSRLKPKMLTEI